MLLTIFLSIVLVDQVFLRFYSSELKIDEYLNVEPECEWNNLVNYLMLMREQQKLEALWG